MTIAAFSQALEDDEKNQALVTFSDAEGKEQKATRSQILEAQYNARIPHGLTDEQIAPRSPRARAGRKRRRASPRMR
jgi:hypothetical protein